MYVALYFECGRVVVARAMSLPKWLAGISLVLLSMYAFVLDAESTGLADSNTRLCTTATYLSRMRALKCNRSYGQQLVDVYLNCGYNQVALMEVNNCGLMNGEFCYAISETVHEYRVAVDSLCFDEFGKPSCSASCQEALWTFREKVGCCINNLYNASDEPIFNDRAASNLLWTGCGVTPVSGFCASTLAYRVVHETRVCVKEEVVYRKSLLECSPDYGQAFADLFRECGYSRLLRYSVNLCGVNEDERYCYEYVNDESAAPVAADVQEKCVEATETERGCPLSCQVALDDLKRQLGCCLNNLYGHEDSENFGTTSPALWKTCNVKKPTFCKTTISMTGGTSESILCTFTTLTTALITTLLSISSP